MNYIKLFQDNTEYESDQPNFLHPHVSYIKDERRVIYEKTAPSHDYSQDYLTFEILESEPSRAAVQGITYDYEGDDIEYSVDGGSTWLTLHSGGTISDLSAGDKVMFRGWNNMLDDEHGCCHFNCTHRFNVSGNLLSMYDGDNFTTLTQVNHQAWGAFCFNRNETLVSAQNLYLAPNLMTPSCFDNMFAGCTSLIAAPKLPKMTLIPRCYRGMFSNCTSLVNAPELPATLLSTSCYESMFAGCTSLETAPYLPAPYMAMYCYKYMFYDCSSLNYIKCDALYNFNDPVLIETTDDWVKGVAREGIFDHPSAATDWRTGEDGIPDGWTIYIDGQPQPEPNDDF